MTMIDVQNVSKWYGEVSALNDVSLEVGPGILGLLGPNGAGKSTLLKLMAGQLRPSLGSVSVLGREYIGDHRLYSSIGLCPEQDALWDEFNGRQFLTCMLRLHGWETRDAQRRCDELLSMFDLVGAQNKRVGGYSKGMRQKLRIAQSFAHNPKVLFLDEPMSGLDASSRSLVADIIRDLGSQGVSIVVSSHILHEVEMLTKEMVVINQGQLRARGNVYEIRELLHDHPLQLEMTVSDPRQLSKALLDCEHVVRIELSDDQKDRLTVFTRRQNQFFEDLPRILKQQDIEIERLHAEDEDMEAVFKYLVH
ncbi:MAG: ABC transporter ATP-binding protein [Acidobacteria bacterium]|nr:ABC transporter ATP-binding protein [Acidobacteriota bacterium]